MPFHRILTTFAAGEWSPLLDGRVDLESYSSGCRTLRNFIPRSYGGAFRRAGTEFMGEAKDHDKKTRLISFNFSTTTSFILAFSDLFLRFWSNGLEVADPAVPTNPLQKTTPWPEAVLFELQFVQINDVMYIVHPDYEPCKLTRVADDEWTLAKVEWTGPALIDENITEVTITPSGTTGTITLTASAAIFEPEHVGSYWEISHVRATGFSELKGSPAGAAVPFNTTSTPIKLVGPWELFSYGIWTGEIALERSFETTAGPWEILRTINSVGDHNVATVGNEEEQCWLRIRAASASGITSVSPGDEPDFRAVIVAGDAKIHGVVKITGYTSGTVVTALVIEDLNATTATKYWSEGAWSDVRGYPRAVTLHDQRLVFGGTRHQPQMIWGSVIGDFEDFTITTLDDGAFAFQVAAQEANAIQWLASQSSLYVGTVGDEWTMSGGGDEGKLITPTNVSARRHSRHGSAYLPGMMVNDVVLFIQRNARRVREFVYAYEKDGYVAPDMTVRAEHITRGGIVQWAVSQQPDSIVYAVTGDGRLITMTYERDQKAVAWSRHDTDGEFESVCAIYGSRDTAEGVPDEIWVVVKRTIGGVTKRYVERFDPQASAFDFSDADRLIYVDSASIYDGAPAAVRTGLTHLEGKTVQVLADGAVQPDRVVTGGQITQVAPSSVAVIGLGFESVLQPNKLELQLQDGSAQGRKFRACRTVINFHKSSGCDVIHDPNGDLPWEAISFRSTDMDMDESVPLWSGNKLINIEGRHMMELAIGIRQKQPLPLNILSIVLFHEVIGS